MPAGSRYCKSANSYGRSTKVGHLDAFKDCSLAWYVQNLFLVRVDIKSFILIPTYCAR